jgi:L-threonylcarbamoyladenylate synthase
MILNGGPCESGVESTVLDMLRPEPAILRPGGVTVEMIEKIIGTVQVYKRDFTDETLENAPTTPGMKYRHYSPDAQVIVIEYCNNKNEDPLARQLRIIAEQIEKAQSQGFKVGVLSVFKKIEAPISINLGYSANDVAKNLFMGLREMESLGVQIILVQGILEENEGMAVMNRIRKASSLQI